MRSWEAKYNQGSPSGNIYWLLLSFLVEHGKNEGALQMLALRAVQDVLHLYQALNFRAGRTD